MKPERKITVMLPEALLERALRATGDGITSTLRKGLELVAAKDSYQALLKLKGKLVLRLDLEESRRDRVEPKASVTVEPKASVTVESKAGVAAEPRTGATKE